MKKPFLAAVFILIGHAAFAAEPQRSEPETPQLYLELVRCRSITEDAARLACLDTALAALDAAKQKRDIVIVERQQIRETKRALFGLAIPRLEILSGTKEQEDEVNEISGVIEGVSSDVDGRWILRLADGARWQQIDGRVLGRSPKPGDEVAIKRAALGSFMMQIRGQPSIRVRRVS